MKCSKCGAEFKAGEEFCGECGTARTGSQSKKGGMGLILAGLGVLLLIIIFIISIAESPTPPSSPEIKPTETTINQVTSEYLIGKWIKSDQRYTLTFNSDGTYLAEDLGDLSSFDGRYMLTGSKIQLNYYAGDTLSDSLNYIDANTFKMGDAVYYRIKPDRSAGTISIDYLIGSWISTAEGTGMGWTFSSDGSYVWVYIENNKQSSGRGRYTLTDSGLKLTSDETGNTKYITLTYIDGDTLKIEGAVFERKILTSPTATKTPSSYIVGSWSATTSNWNEVIVFNRDGNFGAASKDLNTGEISSSDGSYQITDFTLTFYYTAGTKRTFSLTYIDKNTIRLDDIVYTRIIE